jgi:penicillin-binding protein 1C
MVRLTVAAALLLIPGILALLALTPPPPLLEGVAFSRSIEDRNGVALRLSLAGGETYRLRTALDEIAPDAVRVTLLYEDRYFYLHPGVNPFSLLRAAWSTYFGGGRRMGASTITMQVARLRFGLKTATLGGKLAQIWTALLLERHYSKREILEAYFNLVPYGGNIEGIGAAARVYFHSVPARLTREECLALAVTPQNPARRNPLNGRDFQKARARARLLLPEEGGAYAGPRPLRVYGPGDLPFLAPHASAELLAEAGPEGRVRSTLDMRAQRVVEKIISRFTARYGIYGLNNAAALLLHWPTMEIRALVGSANFFEARIQGQVDGTRARRSPGSTLKPFIYALALDQGLIHPMTLLADAPRSFGGYDPENFDSAFQGPLPACEALRLSRNLPAISLASRLRDPDLHAFLRQADVALPEDAEHYGLSLALGGAEVTMRELGRLYAMLANRGYMRPARLAMPDRAGEPEPSRRLLSPEAAFLTLSMLREPGETVASSGGRVPVYKKTGTSNGFRDAWTAGVVGEYALVVWAGNFDNTPNPLLVGGEAAAPLFLDMARALGNLYSLSDPGGRNREGLNLRQVEVCRASGDPDTALCGDVVNTWFIPGVSPVRSSGIFRTVLIDRETGLRACEPAPGRTEERVLEFWPTDMRRIFLRAGIVKAVPPPFSPECAAGLASGAWTAPGKAPRISIPKEGVTYRIRMADPSRNGIPLTADADADASGIFWFAGNTYLGRSEPGKHLSWTPPAGVTELRAVDDLGRSARRKLSVLVAP